MKQSVKHIYRIIKKCRICTSSRLRPVLALGPQYISSTLVKENKNNVLSSVKIPLTLLLCSDCGLIQLKETVNPDLLFCNYFYRSAVNKTMRDNLRDVVGDVKRNVNFKPGDIVADIGSNDGVMLSYFPKRLRRIGVEPAKNIDWSNLDNSVEIINDYFSKESFLKKTHGRKAKAVTAIAMFYDLNDPNQVTRDIKEILADDGIVCIQVSYLYDTVKDMNFYDVCHEHLEYYTLRTLSNLLQRNGLTIFKALTNFTNGGSIRIFATHSARKVKIADNIKEILKKEKDSGLFRAGTYGKFNTRIKSLAKWVRNYIISEIKNNGKVIGLGASTKGNVMIQVCKIDRSILPYISDRNKSKVGFRTLGTDILVISESEARRMKPTMMLVSPWYFRDEIIKREKKYLANGGRLLFVMPYPHILQKDGEIPLQV